MARKFKPSKLGTWKNSQSLQSIEHVSRTICECSQVIIVLYAEQNSSAVSSNGKESFLARKFKLWTQDRGFREGRRGWEAAEATSAITDHSNYLSHGDSRNPINPRRDSSFVKLCESASAYRERPRSDRPGRDYSLAVWGIVQLSLPRQGAFRLRSSDFPNCNTVSRCPPPPPSPAAPSLASGHSNCQTF